MISFFFEAFPKHYCLLVENHTTMPYSLVVERFKGIDIGFLPLVVWVQFPTKHTLEYSTSN